MTVRLRFRMNEWTFSATIWQKGIELGVNVESTQVCLFVKKKKKRIISKECVENKDGRMEGRGGKVGRIFWGGSVSGSGCGC